MRRSARCVQIVLLAGLFVGGPLARSAAAVSVEDLVNLKANGLSDDVLIALIQADRTTFQLSADDIIQLRQRGLGDRVIVAMLNTAASAVRPPAPEASPAPAQAPATSPVAFNEHVITQQVTVNSPMPAVTYAVPIFLPVVWPARALAPPVYWGYGGRLRADAWQPPAPVPPPHQSIPPTILGRVR